MEHRAITSEDLPILQDALDKNEFHPGLKTDYFTGENMYTEMYGEESPIGFVRYTKALRIAAVWCDNDDRSRNARATIQAIKDAVERAKASGFKEIIFNTNSPKLAEFCTKVLGFHESSGEYVKYVNE